jgi:hypothetical protein
MAFGQARGAVHASVRPGALDTAATSQRFLARSPVRPLDNLQWPGHLVRRLAVLWARRGGRQLDPVDTHLEYA